MDLNYYYNMAGQRFPMTEQRLEPLDDGGGLDGNDEANQDEFIKGDVQDFIDFIRKLCPIAIPAYLKANERQWDEFLGVS